LVPWASIKSTLVWICASIVFASLCLEDPTTVSLSSFLVWGLRRGEFGHGLGSFTNGMLGQFPGKHQPNRRLDFTTGKGCLFVIRSKLSSFSSNAIKDVLNERVHDAHALFADTGIGMDLFEDLVNVTGIRFGTFGTLALATGGCLFGGCRLGTGGLFGGCLGHLVLFSVVDKQGVETKPNEQARKRQIGVFYRRHQRVWIDRKHPIKARTRPTRIKTQQSYLVVKKMKKGVVLDRDLLCDKEREAFVSTTEKRSFDGHFAAPENRLQGPSVGGFGLSGALLAPFNRSPLLLGPS
jgi:hypothetical protein